MNARIRQTLAYPALSTLLVVIFALFAGEASGQEVVDKTVATVSDGTRTELITYSDLLWELALQPGVPLSPARSEDLTTVLNVLVDQRIFALEAERIPRDPPAPEAVEAEIARVLKLFPSVAEFERRLRLVGFSSVKDSNFERMIAKRIAIERYVDFRFRSFIVNTPAEQARYYNETYVPDFRRRYGGLLMPTLDEERKKIDGLLTETKVLSNIEAFLDDAKRRVQIEILNPV